MDSRKFDKSPLKIEEQINLLLKRGLIIKDQEKGKNFLQFISFFRLRGYINYF